MYNNSFLYISALQPKIKNVALTPSCSSKSTISLVFTLGASSNVIATSFFSSSRFCVLSSMSNRCSSSGMTILLLCAFKYSDK